MSLWKHLVKVAGGAAESAATYQMKNDPKLRKKARQKAEGCTPCAASAYTQGLRQWAGQFTGRK